MKKKTSKITARFIFLASLFWGLQISTTFLWSEEGKKTTEQIVKSVNDKNKYQKVVLTNGIRGVVFQDKGEYSTIAITVNAGSLDNPKDVQGLAHFVEHLLFLGTKEFPKVNYLTKYLTKYGGFNNAYTAPDRTTYFVRLRNDGLSKALEILSRFFVNPLFSKLYVTKELQAVNSEYSISLQNDYQIVHHIQNSLFNQNHSASFFSTGNKETLNIPKIREKVIAFYKKFYGAKNITFAIQGGDQSLEQLESLAEKWLSDIPQRTPITPESRSYAKIPIFSKKRRMPLSLKIKTQKDVNKLDLTFYLERDYSTSYDYYTNPPDTSTSYIKNLFNCNLKGCLIYYLKKRGWAKTGYSFFSYETPVEFNFTTSFDLTSKGTKHLPEIKKAFWTYLNLIQTSPVEKWRYDEMKQVLHTYFDFQSKQDPVTLTIRLSERMRYVPYDQLLTYGNLPRKPFDEKEIKMFLQKINPTNLIETYQAKDVVGNQTNYWYKTPYKINQMNSDLDNFKIQAESPLTKEFALPPANPYVPGEIEVVEGLENKYPHPQRLTSFNTSKNKTRFEVWYQGETKFNDPKILLSLYFILPKFSTNPKETTYLNMLETYLKQEISFEYNALFEVGNDISLAKKRDGYVIEISAYPSNLKKVLVRLPAILFDRTLDEEKFNIDRKERIRNYANAKEKTPLSIIFNKFNSLSYSRVYFDDEMEREAKKAQFIQFKETYTNFLKSAKLQVLVMGNLTADYAEEIGEEIEKLILKDDYFSGVSSSERSENTLLAVDKGEWLRLVATHSQDIGFARYYYLPKRTYLASAGLEVLEEILGPKYFEQLRTQKQFGYNVGGQAQTFNRHNGFIFFVQSPSTDAPTLAKETTSFIDAIEPILPSILDKNFNAIRKSLIKKYEEPAKRLSDLANKYFRALEKRDEEFLLNQPTIEGLKRLTKEDVLDIFHDTFQSSDKRSLDFWAPKARKDTKLIKEFTGHKKVITDIKKYKRESSRVPIIKDGK